MTARTFDNSYDPATLHVLPPPADHVGFLAEHGFSAVANAVPADVAIAAGDDLLRLHHEVWGSGRSSATERRDERHLAWRLDEAPDSVIDLLSQESLHRVIYEGYGRDDVRFATWVIFYRPAGEPGTFWHADAGYIPLTGPVLQYWLPVIPSPTEQGLLYRSRQTGEAETYTFSGMTPGALSYHDVNAEHAGQTYDQLTLAISFITYLDGAFLESDDHYLFTDGRERYRRRIFPDRAYGARAVNKVTPLLSEISAPTS
ncbi:MAG: hypothetical protein ACKO70_01170 [Actinomycetota bacterium]